MPTVVNRQSIFGALFEADCEMALVRATYQRRLARLQGKLIRAANSGRKTRVEELTDDRRILTEEAPREELSVQNSILQAFLYRSEFCESLTLEDLALLLERDQSLGSEIALKTMRSDRVDLHMPEFDPRYYLPFIRNAGPNFALHMHSLYPKSVEGTLLLDDTTNRLEVIVNGAELVSANEARMCCIIRRYLSERFPERFTPPTPEQIEAERRHRYEIQHWNSPFG